MRVAPPAPAVKRGVLRWALGVAAVLAALLTGLCTLWLIGYETGVVPFLAGLVAAALPVPVYVTLVLWLDRYEPEPPWMLATAFFWGALVAGFFAISPPRPRVRDARALARPLRARAALDARHRLLLGRARRGLLRDHHQLV